MTVEEHRVTDRELRERPRVFGRTVDDVLFSGGPLMLGRGVERPGPADRWEAWRELTSDTIVVRIERGGA